MSNIAERKVHMFDFNGTTVDEFHPKKSVWNFGKAYFGMMDLNDGVREYLDNLTSKGKKTALVTSAKQKHLNWFKNANLEEAFGFICKADGYENKREQYLATLDKLGEYPDNAVAYEDSPEGIDAVRSIKKLKLCIVKNELIHNQEELWRPNDAYIESFRELVETR